MALENPDRIQLKGVVDLTKLKNWPYKTSKVSYLLKAIFFKEHQNQEKSKLLTKLSYLPRVVEKLVIAETA